MPFPCQMAGCWLGCIASTCQPASQTILPPPPSVIRMVIQHLIPLRRRPPACSWLPCCCKQLFPGRAPAPVFKPPKHRPARPVVRPARTGNLHIASSNVVPPGRCPACVPLRPLSWLSGRVHDVSARTAPRIALAPAGYRRLPAVQVCLPGTP